MAERVHWLGSLVIVGVALAACEEPPRGAARPAIVLTERGIELPAGGVAAVGVKLEGLTGAPLRLSFDPLASSGSIHGKVRRTSHHEAVLELSTSRTVPPGVHDGLVVGTGGGLRVVGPIQIRVVARPVVARERGRVEVGELGYDAFARARSR